jgi:hypothetical protein
MIETMLAILAAYLAGWCCGKTYHQYQLRFYRIEMKRSHDRILEMIRYIAAERQVDDLLDEMDMD